MKEKKLFAFRSILLALIALMLSIEATFAQDALTSVKINIQNVRMSVDQKTVSYDVYFQDVDAASPVAIPGYLFRLSVPQADLGTNAKTVRVTNASTALGATSATMTVSGTNWLMKFTNANFISTYEGALLASETFPGTLVGTFNISNVDGTIFMSPQVFHGVYSGTTLITETTVTVFLKDQVVVAPNISTAQPITNFSGLGAYSLRIPLTASDPTLTPTKQYSGTITAAVTPGTLSNVLDADKANVTLTATAVYDNATVGTGKTITVTYGLTGSAATKYNAPVNYTVTNGIITALPLTISDSPMPLSKVYDGTTTATVTAGAISGVLAADESNVALTTTAVYDNKTMGTGKIVTVFYGLTGSAAVNYIAPATGTLATGKITGLPLTVSVPTITLGKVYDGTATSTVTTGILSGVLDADKANVTLTPIAIYDNATVGTGKTITVTYGLTGTASSNYIAPGSFSVGIGVITALPLTVSAPTITLSKVSDGTTLAALIAGTLSGVLSGDMANIALTALAVYNNATVGTGKTITVTYVLTGSASANYSAPASSSVTNGVILAIPKELAVKVYLEGLWNGTNMNKCKEWDADLEDVVNVFGGAVIDTVSVLLHDPDLYATILYQAHGLELNQDGNIHTPGKSFIDIPGELTGSYRLTVKHRNHIETTSSSAIPFAGNTINYDFTDAVSKAYQSDPSRNPTKEVTAGKWMFYVGDIQTVLRPEIDNVDLYKTFNDRSGSTGTYGYVLSDLDGSGVVDDGDIYLLFANRDALLYIP